MINWTPEQKKAIFDHDKDILVSAAAGSGKTTILIERVIEKILSGIDIDSLLIVTFTKLAAKEMKDRLISRLQSEINLTEDTKIKGMLIQQLSKVPSANISTLHSFCSTVIKKFYYLIDLDPSFRLISDETEQELLKEQAWNKVKNSHYKIEDNDFINLTKNFSNDRDDNGLQDLIFKLYSFATTRADTIEWLNSLVNEYDLQNKNFEESDINKKVFKPYLLEYLNEQLKLIKKALSISLENESCEKFVDSLEEAENLISNIINNFFEYSHNELGDLLSGFSFKRVKTIKGIEKDGASDYVEELRKLIKKNISEDIPNNFLITQNDNLSNIINDSKKIINSLIKAEKEFIETFRKIKLEKNSIDFNDLEHFTLNILKVKEDNKFIAKDFYVSQFSEIMIDEYQDVNPMQESIVQNLHNESNSFFMVGDIKQSIYGFRQADPSLFADKYERFENKNENNELILLSNNFRSSTGVTTFVNRIFELIMDSEIGGINYDDKAKLIPGAEYSSEADVKVETDIISLENQNLNNKRKSQIQYVANRINQLVNDKFKVFDTKYGEFRNIKYSDIAILSRTNSNNTDLISVFSNSNIPVIVSESKNYFQTMEIQVIVEFLKLIDNPQQDVALVAVLRSPIVQLNENELAEIRVDNKNVNFYNAVINYEKENNNDLSDKLSLFLDILEEFRFESNQIKISELIWKIYQKTGFLDFVTGMPGGNQRSANLHALYQRADEFENMGFKGLYRFINFIERIEKNKKDLSQPNNVESNADAVNVMSIHGSKGLEFPIVFLIDSSREFNNKDYISSTLIDRDFGLGTKYLDKDNRVLYSTPQRNYTSKKKKISSLSEELRLLYVALTRAKQKLFIVGTEKKLDKSLNKWSNVNIQNGKIDYFDRINFKSYLDIIMSCIFQDSVKISDKSYFNEFLNTETNIIQSDKLEKISSENKNNSTLVMESGIDSKFSRTVSEILNFKYSYRNSIKTTAYQSVSEIKFLFSDPDEDILTKSGIITSGKYTTSEFSKPNFLNNKSSVSAAEVGSATHLVLQKLDVSEIPSVNSINKLINNLISNNLLNKEVANRIDVNSIMNFFNSDIGQLALNKKNTLKREYPFSMIIPASEIFKEVSIQDDILIHGIIDGLVETSDGIIIIDYKTDNVVEEVNAKNSIQYAVKKYSGQLNLYESAINSMQDKPVIGKYLFFLKLGKYVKV